MAKEKEAKTEVKAEVKEGYAISDVVLKKGYRAKIDNRIFHIHAPLKNRAGVVVKESFIEVQDGFDPASGTPIMKTVDTLTDLSDRQLKELVFAGVLKLTEKQEKEFGSKFLKPNV